MDGTRDAAILTRMDWAQCFLLPPNAREIAEGLGLDWWAALKLRDDGWLSFDPETAQITDEGMEAEFVFLGSLVAAGCDPSVLKKLLAGLTKPYRYDIRRAYYDWRLRKWQRFPPVPPPEASFNSWLAELVQKKDVDTLSDILESVETALNDIEKAIEGDPEPVE